MRGKTDSWRNHREVVVDSRKPMSQGSEYVVRCLSSHLAQSHSHMTSWPLWKYLRLSLFSLLQTLRILFLLVLHTHSTQKQSHICTHAPCVQEWTECSAALRCTKNCSSFSSKEHCILRNRERARWAKAENESATVLTSTWPRSYPVPVIIVTSVKVMETWFGSAWSQHCCVY